MENVKRGRGRPRLAEPTIRVSVQFDAQVLRDLDTMCAFSGRSRAQVIQDVISANYETFLDTIEKYPEFMTVLQKKKRKGGVDES